MVSRVIPVDPFDLVIFGGTGDLARRKILPALFRRFCAGQLEKGARIIGAARTDVRENRILPVPRHLRDSHYREAGQLGHGTGYQYSHDEDDGIASQDYLGVDREYYQPVDRGFESELAQRLSIIRTKLKQAKE